MPHWLRCWTHVTRLFSLKWTSGNVNIINNELQRRAPVFNGAQNKIEQQGIDGQLNSLSLLSFERVYRNCDIKMCIF